MDRLNASCLWCLQDSLSSYRKNVTINETLAARRAISCFCCHIFDPHTKSDAVLGDHILHLVLLLLSWFTGIFDLCCCY